jgi:4-amino-4-deoxy-L-arabinose transferase-like glycosyltransferase
MNNNPVKKVATRLMKLVIKHKHLVLLIIFYFVFRLINLTKLPIFNDEAIYLDWGWRETHRDGFLYYSLYDAKQPFLMWIFGIAESVISDSLFAGRLISVIFGFLTFVGIYKLAKFLFEEKIALISVFIYSIVPIFAFYDRQALMESSIATVGIWSCFFLVKYLKENSLKFSILAGIILGIGFFIKSSALVFILPYILLVLSYSIVYKRVKIINDLLLTAGVFLMSISLLLINPQFWSTFSSNSRYSLTIIELSSFPIGQWINSLFDNLQIAFFYVTPLLFLLSLIGAAFILIKKNVFKRLFLFFFVLSLLIATLLVRVPTERYLVSFLPFLVIPASYIIIYVLNKSKFLGVIFMIIIFIIPFSLTAVQVVNPAEYILLMGKVATFNDSNYLKGFTSGYAVDEVINYFQKLSEKQKIIITIGENTGNPESAVLVYFSKNSNVQVIYFDSRLFGPSISALDCFKSNIPLYFVSREEQLVGLDKFLEKIKTIKNPYGINTIGIYTLKKNCKGKTFNLQISPT